MDTGRWLTAMALTLFLAEGFALSVFPRQFRQLLIETDPRWLQVAGLAETAVAVALIAGMMAAR
jgi:hypothetical protein